MDKSDGLPTAQVLKAVEQLVPPSAFEREKVTDVTGSPAPAHISSSYDYASAGANSSASTRTECGTVIVRCPSRSSNHLALMIVTPITSPSGP